MKITTLLILFNSISFAQQSDIQGNNWEEKIEYAKNLQDELIKKAENYGVRISDLGTLYNEYMIPQHNCTILGSMLEMRQYTKHLETSISEINAPSGVDGERKKGFQLVLAAHSTGNWFRVAEMLFNKSKDKRKIKWNLDCAGSHDIPSDAAFRDIQDTFYEIERDGRRLMIYGDIKSGFHSKLVEVLNNHQDIETIYLGSGGGSVMEAIYAGEEIRRRGLDTSLHSNCYSACPIVFVGGISRHIWSPYPELGFHKVSRHGKELNSNHPIYRYIRNYLNNMGVEVATFMKFMKSANIDEMHTPRHDDLCDANIATWVQRLCFSN